MQDKKLRLYREIAVPGRIPLSNHDIESSVFNLFKEFGNSLLLMNP